jgi:anti-sigma factor RsiW
MSDMRQTDRARSSHVAGEDLALYVIEALDPERREALESHVFSCDECAEALAREARVEAAFEQVARLAGERLAGTEELGGGSAAAQIVSIMPAIRSAEARARLVSGGRRSRWAGGVGGALAAAAALVLAFASATARSEPAGVAQRAPGLHDAAGDMSGALGCGETVLRDSLDGG